MDEHLFDLLANPEKTSKISDKTSNLPTIDDEIIRLINIKLLETGKQIVFDKSKFEKMVKYIISLK
jgi:hypothetical protein